MVPPRSLSTYETSYTKCIVLAKLFIRYFYKAFTGPKKIWLEMREVVQATKPRLHSKA